MISVRIKSFLTRKRRICSRRNAAFSWTSIAPIVSTCPRRNIIQQQYQLEHLEEHLLLRLIFLRSPTSEPEIEWSWPALAQQTSDKWIELQIMIWSLYLSSWDVSDGSDEFLLNARSLQWVDVHEWVEVLDPLGSKSDNWLNNLTVDMEFAEYAVISKTTFFSWARRLQSKEMFSFKRLQLLVL